MVGGVVATLATTFIGKALEAFTSYNNKQISKAELEARVGEAMLSTFAEVHKAQAAALAQTFGSFMGSAQTSLLMRVMWAAVVCSQLVVLIWHQIGIPALVYLGAGPYPSSGTTVEWAYLLLAGCLGMGPVVLNAGPGRIAKVLRP